MKEEIAGFRKSFEDKMVEELDEHKAKIGMLQQLIRNKEEVVLEKMKEKQSRRLQRSRIGTEVKTMI